MIDFYNFDLLSCLRIPIKIETSADLKVEIFCTVVMHRVITAFLEKTETIKYFSYFTNNFSYVIPKINKKISQNFHQNIKKLVQCIAHVSSNFLHNFAKILKKYFLYFFIISTKSVI